MIEGNNGPHVGQHETTMMHKKRFRDKKNEQSEWMREKLNRKELMRASLVENQDHEAALKNWTQCCFFLAKKKRYCNIERCPDSLYCGNHRPPGEIPSNRALKRAKESEGKANRNSRPTGEANKAEDDGGLDTTSKRQSSHVSIARMPCPIDPTHTIYCHDLERHLKICNTKTREEAVKTKAYYCMDCNAGNEAQNKFIPQKSSSSSSLPSLSYEGVDVDALIAKIQACFDGPVRQQIIEDTPAETVTSTTVTKDILAVVAGTQTAFDRLKHAKQDAALVNRMIEANLVCVDRPDGVSHNDDCDDELKDKNDVHYAEFGAGKGLLGLAVSCAQPKAMITFIERNGLRWKADKMMGNLGRPYQRIRMDIKHFSLEGLLKEDAKQNVQESLNKSKSVVVVAKHLCGVATDFAIRSLCNLATSSGDSLDRRARGLAVATCCHHNCLIGDYCGWEFLASFGFTPIEFEVMTHWSGWAHTLTNSSVQSSKKKKKSSQTTSSESERQNTLRSDDINLEGKEDGGEDNEDDKDNDDDDDDDDAENNHTAPKRDDRVPKPTQLGPMELSAIGKKIKRIFDYGRTCYLRKIGFEAYVVNYCSAKLSPECYAIVAKNSNRFETRRSDTI